MRPLVYAIMVVATAASPVFFGALLDGGVIVATISGGSIAAALMASAVGGPVAVPDAHPDNVT